MKSKVFNIEKNKLEYPKIMTNSEHTVLFTSDYEGVLLYSLNEEFTIGEKIIFNTLEVLDYYDFHGSIKLTQ